MSWEQLHGLLSSTLIWTTVRTRWVDYKDKEYDPYVEKMSLMETYY